MAIYKCFNCEKSIKSDIIRKRVRCPHCGSKILFKPRVITTKIKAR